MRLRTSRCSHASAALLTLILGSVPLLVSGCAPWMHTAAHHTTPPTEPDPPPTTHPLVPSDYWDEVAAATAAAYCIAKHPYKPLDPGADPTPDYPSGFTPDSYEVVAHPGFVGAVRRNYVRGRSTTTTDEAALHNCAQACREFGKRFEPSYYGVPLHRKVIGAVGLTVITDGLGDIGDYSSMAMLDSDFISGGDDIAGAMAVMVGEPWHESDVAQLDYCCCGVRSR